MLALEPDQVLLLMAEVSIAFAGFASLIAIFGMRSGSAPLDFDLLRFWVMLEVSLAALALSLFPFVLGFLAVSTAATWAICSVVLAVFVIVHNVVLAALYARGHPAVRGAARSVSLIVAQMIYLAIVLSQIANALGFLNQTFGWYLFGMYLLLVVASAHFVLFIAQAVSTLSNDG